MSKLLRTVESVKLKSTPIYKLILKISVFTKTTWIYMLLFTPVLAITFVPKVISNITTNLFKPYLDHWEIVTNKKRVMTSKRIKIEAEIEKNRNLANWQQVREG